jgi:hypothetical protein
MTQAAAYRGRAGVDTPIEPRVVGIGRLVADVLAEVRAFERAEAVREEEARESRVALAALADRLGHAQLLAGELEGLPIDEVSPDRAPAALATVRATVGAATSELSRRLPRLVRGSRRGRAGTDGDADRALAELEELVERLRGEVEAVVRSSVPAAVHARVLEAARTMCRLTDDLCRERMSGGAGRELDRGTAATAGAGEDAAADVDPAAECPPPAGPAPRLMRTPEPFDAAFAPTAGEPARRAAPAVSAPAPLPVEVTSTEARSRVGADGGEEPVADRSAWADLPEDGGGEDGVPSPPDHRRRGRGRGRGRGGDCGSSRPRRADRPGWPGRCGAWRRPTRRPRSTSPWHSCRSRGRGSGASSATRWPCAEWAPSG